jgi:hypothetical protein
MSVTLGPKLGLMIDALTGDQHDIAFRKLLRAIDQLSFLNVKSTVIAAPPGSPANGDAYIVAAGGSGAWASHDLSVAVWTTDNPVTPSGLWEFYVPNKGWLAYSQAASAFFVWNGTAWVKFGVIIGGGAPADTNVLTWVAADSAWEPMAAGGGGGVAAGTPVMYMGNHAPRVIGPLGTGNTLYMKLTGRSLYCLPTHWKVRIQRGAGSHFTAITVLRTLPDSLAVIDSTAVTFGGSASPTMAAGLNTSDAIALALDAQHDYYVMAYNDSGDSSYFGISPAFGDSYSSAEGLIGGYIGGGDYTAVNPVGNGGSFSPGFGNPYDAVLAA